MLKRFLTGLTAAAFLLSSAVAQNSPSGSPRVQGVPAGYGDPVQVTIRNTDGSAPGAMGSVTVSSSALPTGAATAANQTTNTTAINTNVGAPGDTACATDNGSCALNALLQRNNQRLTTINTTLGSPLQAGGSLAANQSVNAAQINGVTPLMGNGVTGTGSLRVTLASDTSSNTNPLLFNQSQINGVALSTGNGVVGTGVQRVAIASDNTAFSVNAVESGTWNITNVSGTVSLPTGASTSANQTTELTDLGATNETAPASDTASSGLNGRLQRIAQNLTTMNATPLVAGTNVIGAVGISPSYRASSKLASHIVAAANNNAQTIITGTHQLLGISIHNRHATNWAVLKIYNKATSPNPASDTAVLVFACPPGGTFIWNDHDSGMPFSLGVSIAIVTGFADTDNTSIANAADVIVNIEVI